MKNPKNYVEMEWTDKDTLEIILDGKTLDVIEFKIKSWIEKEKDGTFSQHTRVKIKT